VEVKYRYPVVSIEEWLNNTYFIGGEVIWDYWKAKIIEFYKSGDRSFIFYGSYGLGKTYIGLIMMLRQIYEIYCVENFLELFGMSPTTHLIMIFISLKKSTAQESGIGRLVRMAETIPFFKDVCRFDHNLKTKLRFDFLTVMGGSQIGDMTALDVIGGIFDESSFVRAKKGEEFNKAKELWLELKKRAKSRFTLGGVNWGWFGMLSSAKYKTSFTEQALVNAEGVNSKTFMVKTAMYDVRRERYSKKEFGVFIGSEDVDSHICEVAGEQVLLSALGYATEAMISYIGKNYGFSYEQWIERQGKKVVRVPEDFREDFEDDVDGALRDLAGVARTRSSLLLKRISLLDGAISDRLANPIMRKYIELSVRGDEEFGQYVDEGLLWENYEEGEELFAHVDQSIGGAKTNDKTGIAFVYKSSYTGKFVTLLYVSITNVPGKTIDLAKVLDIVFWLLDRGYTIRYVSYDQFASIFARQMLSKRLGEKYQGLQSVDRDDTQYLFFIYLLKKGFLEIYKYDPFWLEIKNLIYDAASNKIDHPDVNEDGSKGSKDVSDALVGAIYNCYTFKGLEVDEIVMDTGKVAGESKSAMELNDIYGGFEDDGFYTSCMEDGDSVVDNERESDSSLLLDGEIQKRDV
jgi:hypothetical protein